MVIFCIIIIISFSTTDTQSFLWLTGLKLDEESWDLSYMGIIQPLKMTSDLKVCFFMCLSCFHAHPGILVLYSQITKLYQGFGTYLFQV